MEIQCVVCQAKLKEEHLCEICGLNVCSLHSSSDDNIIACDFCSGKDISFFDRDLEDFRGTGM